jgi:hypothetical protein
MTALFTNLTRSKLRRRLLRFGAAETHQRVHTEWFDLASFNQLGATMRLRPCRQTVERKLRP